MFTRRSFVVIMFSVGLMVLGTAAAWAQGFPNKPIRIVTAEAGGANDLHARGISPGLTEILGQPVLIENRGGSGVIPIGAVAKAPPDGHTLLVYGQALWLLPYMQTVSYDPLKDLTPITAMTTAPGVVVVHPSLPVKSIRELIALVKARPGELNYASGIAGSITHLPAELFKAMAGVDIKRVAYKGGAPALNAIVGGEVQVMFAAGFSAAPLVKAGKLRALAVTSAQPSGLFPGLPTVAGDGLPGYEAGTVQGIFAPGKTPAPVITRLNNEIVKVLNRTDVKERFLKSGFEVVADTSEQFTTFIKADMARMGKVIKDAGIREE